ncbi:hypothetical protein B0J14DRAFT_656652 [Halenospora varia]|nr:hypothetical protein B0J14DRAFT_656652 [Halenospora varia]
MSSIASAAAAASAQSAVEGSGPSPRSPVVSWDDTALDDGLLSSVSSDEDDQHQGVSLRDLEEIEADLPEEEEGRTSFNVPNSPPSPGLAFLPAGNHGLPVFVAPADLHPTFDEQARIWQQEEDRRLALLAEREDEEEEMILAGFAMVEAMISDGETLLLDDKKLSKYRVNRPSALRRCWVAVEEKKEEKKGEKKYDGMEVPDYN